MIDSLDVLVVAISFVAHGGGGQDLKQKGKQKYYSQRENY